MTTATEYRQYAQECIQSAQNAASDPVRKQFLDLAKLWMTAAERIDGRSGLPSPVHQLNGKKPPGVDRTE